MLKATIVKTSEDWNEHKEVKTFKTLKELLRFVDEVEEYVIIEKNTMYKDCFETDYILEIYDDYRE